MNKYTAEIIGTLILTLAVSLSLAGSFPVPTPVIAGLALGAGVYIFGSISGAHFNPAITLGLLSIGKISANDAILYISSQLIGAAAAAQIARHLVKIPPMTGPSDGIGLMMGELMGTAVLAFAVAAVVQGKVSQGAQGLTIGGALLLGISIAASVSNGVLNPAVALGISSFSFSYMLGPIVGAVLAMGTYKYLTGTTTTGRKKS